MTKGDIMKKLCGALIFFTILFSSALPWCGNNPDQPGNKNHKKIRNKVYFCSYKTKAYYGSQANRYYNGTTCKVCGCDTSEHKDPKTNRKKMV